jgi:hypothetical protein
MKSMLKSTASMASLATSKLENIAYSDCPEEDILDDDDETVNL